MRSRSLTLVLAGIAAAALIATLPAEAQRRKDTVVVGMSQEPDTIGTFSIMVASRVVENALFARIAPYTDKWQRLPMMVEKMPSLKDGDWALLPNNKMKVTWRLKRGFTWHDGKPVTALDWRFTFGLARNPLTPEIGRSTLKKVDNVLVPDPNDPYTLVVQWNERFPFANAEPFGWSYPLPRHILEPAYLKDPTKLPAHPYFGAPLGQGPYRFVEWIKGSHITLEAYDRFPLGAPKIKRLTFRFILDTTVLQAAHIAGDVDASDNNGFDCLALEQIERRNAAVRGHYTEALSLERIDFNLDNEWLKDRRVRQAIAHAIDRIPLSELACSGGRQPVAHSWVSLRHPAFNANVRKYNYDPGRARALFTEAGFTPGPDGILRDANGKRVEMTIMSTSGNALREQIELVIRDQLKQIGIDLRVDNRPSSVFLGVIVPRRQFPHMAMYGSLFGVDLREYDRFHSSQIPTQQNNWEGNNRAGWRNAENDRIWDQLITELDEGKRTALLKRHQELFAEEMPWLPLRFRLSLTTSNKKLANIRPTGLGTYYLPWNSWEWKWED